jgi:hypothetical protein
MCTQDVSTQRSTLNGAKKDGATKSDATKTAPTKKKKIVQPASKQKATTDN